MVVELSRSTRLLLAILLLLALLFQIALASSRVIAYSYAHNGDIVMAEENWSDAAWYFQHANDWFPYNHRWLYQLGVAEHNLGNIQEAADALDKSIKHSPTYVYALCRAAGIMIETGNQIIATDLIIRGENVVPNYWEPIYLEGLNAFSVGDFNAATEMLLLADQHSLESKAATLGFLAQAAMESDRRDLARYAIDQAVTADRGTAQLWFQRGNIHYTLGNTAIAAQSLEKAADLFLASEEQTDSLPVQLASSYARIGQIQAEIGALDKSINGYYRAATFYADLSSHAGSVKSVDAGLEPTLLNRSAGTRMQWACVLAATQLWNEASALFESLPQDTYDWSPLDRYSYAMTLRFTGRPDEALEQFKAIPEQDFMTSLAYAETLFELGRPAAARFEYTKISTRFPLTDAQRTQIQNRLDQLTQRQ